MQTPLARALCRTTLAGRLAAFLEDPITRAILELPQEKLDAYLINDAYKPRMHKCAACAAAALMCCSCRSQAPLPWAAQVVLCTSIFHRSLYAKYFTAVTSDFELSIRKTPLPLRQIREEVGANGAICLQCWEATATMLLQPPCPLALRQSREEVGRWCCCGWHCSCCRWLLSLFQLTLLLPLQLLPWLPLRQSREGASLIHTQDPELLGSSSNPFSCTCPFPLRCHRILSCGIALRRAAPAC